MEVVDLVIPGVKLITPRKFGDDRGFVSETYSRRKFAEVGITLDFVQNNHSYSARAGTVRGLHFQAPPHAQDKLVRVLRGSIVDVAVDIRRGSPTYGQHVHVLLSAENWRQLLVPVGFAHGFATLEPDVEVLYKVTDFYAPEAEGGILWSDSTLGIDWQIEPANVTVADRDAAFATFDNFESPFTYHGDEGGQA